MNKAELEKNIKRVKILTVLKFITIPLFFLVILFLILMILASLGIIRGDGSFFSALGNTLAFFFTALGIFIPAIVIEIVAFVYTIFVLIYAFKFNEKKYATLIILGLFIGVVGLAGLFMFNIFLKNKLNEIPQEELNHTTSNTEESKEEI